MSKIIIIFLLITTSCFAQLELRNNPYLKGEIILIDGNVKNGFVKLNGSAFSVEFKENEDQRKPDKIDYKSINKIVINSELSGRREFYYKKTDADKFYKFVELIYSNNLEVYVYSPDNLSLFYSGVDRSNVNDFLVGGVVFNGSNAIWIGRSSVSVIKENLAKAKNIKHLLSRKDSEKLNFVYSNKKLNEYAVENFSDCPGLISKIENEQLQLENIFEIVDLYNNCKI
ncbi:hypothetical protein AAGV28_11130 [Flavobacterium sp. FZUC8N2.13]|uniref:DUF4369 domain-containing protein n=1 Tax=Flavobacterium zubiriense TaxID=3138075 RepID=A0ABV4TCT0_9FLAO